MRGTKAKMLRRYAKGRGKQPQGLLGIPHKKLVLNPDGETVQVTRWQAVLNHCDRMVTKLLKQAATGGHKMADVLARRAILHKQGAGAGA